MPSCDNLLAELFGSFDFLRAQFKHFIIIIIKISKQNKKIQPVTESLLPCTEINEFTRVCIISIYTRLFKIKPKFSYEFKSRWIVSLLYYGFLKILLLFQRPFHDNWKKVLGSFYNSLNWDGVNTLATSPERWWSVWHKTKIITPGVNFINVYARIFCTKFFGAKNYKAVLRVWKFWHQKILYEKRVHKRWCYWLQHTSWNM